MSSVQPSSFSRKFTDDVLKGVILTGKELGRGSDAIVVEADFEGTFCAAKQLHAILLEDKSSSGAQALIANFEKEINTWRSLRHPHIVQLIGVYFEPGSRVPTLIMEKVQTSLRKYIETNKKGDIPLPDKVSILHQVAQALSYLHSRQPPLVHHDLSPNNILLNQGSFQIKITDFGLSRFVDPLHPTRKSSMKGTIAFMPPEVLCSPPKYTQKLDIFSFGNVIIFTISHRWPEPAGPAVVYEGDTPVAVEEWQRREQHTRTFTAEERTTFFPMVRPCLENRPDRRPTSLQLVYQFRQMEKASSTKRSLDKKTADQSTGVFNPIRHIYSSASVLTGVRFTGRVLGRGSDAVVVEAVFEETLCAAKQLHAILLNEDQSVGGAQRLLGNLDHEIRTWAKLRHPHIVQLIGVYFEPGSLMPIMITEKMQTSLLKYIETYKKGDIPLPDKVSILHQVSQALAYLHSHQPPLVHHDLVPNNILLNQVQDSFQTKITDFGMSRFVDPLRPTRKSSVKGTLAFMPPEALCNPPKYTEKLDIFSFGNVIIFTIAHLWPEPGPSVVYEGNKLIPVEELQRREMITRTLTAEERSLFFPMIRSCLENRPGLRPTSLQLVQQMTRMEEVYPRPAQKQ